VQADPRPRDHSTTTVVILVLALLIAIVFVAIRPRKDESKAMTPFERGKKIFSLNCIGCHDKNPNKQYGEGSGPPLAGSSYELLELRVRNRSYPKGHKPKRDTQSMPAIYLTSDQLRALHTYIQDFDAGRPN